MKIVVRIFRVIKTSYDKFIFIIVLKRKYKKSYVQSFDIAKDVEIGDGSQIYKNVSIGPKVKIGMYTLINLYSYVATAEIGNFTSIGRNCQIGVPEHPLSHLSTSPYIYDKDRSILGIDTWKERRNPVIIGNDVWVGSNVVIMQGIKIGDGAIIGAGAVVTKDVAPFSIVVGMPAREIKKRFNEETIEYLLELQWWNMPTEKIKNYKYLFQKRDKWVNYI